MTYDDMILYFGNAYKVAKQMKLGSGTVYHWKRAGFIPIDTQRQIELFTEGRLKASLDDLLPVKGTVD